MGFINQFIGFQASQVVQDFAGPSTALPSGFTLFSLRKPSGPVRELIRNSEPQVVEELSSIRSKVIGINRINGCK